MMTKQLICAAVLAAVMGMAAPTGWADPTPAPSPYQIAGPSGPVVGGLRTLPPICGTQPRACAGDWDPNSGTWVFPPGTGSP
jgi:hypothetical protein